MRWVVEGEFSDGLGNDALPHVHVQRLERIEQLKVVLVTGGKHEDAAPRRGADRFGSVQAPLHTNETGRAHADDD